MSARTYLFTIAMGLVVCQFQLPIASGDELPEARRNFISCPIVRDTATVPCWLSEYEGELYYLGIQTDISADFDPPYLGHRVLVEGTVSDAPRICGGIVLDPVIVSPLAEFDANCNTILPAEDQYQVPFAPRPPGPSGGRLAFDPPPGSQRQPQAPPSGEREFEIYYDFDMLIMGRHSRVLTQVLSHAQAIGARHIVISAERGSNLLSDGTVIVEQDGIGQKRARELADILSRGGLDADTIEVDWSDRRNEPDGLDDWRSRHASIRVAP